MQDKKNKDLENEEVLQEEQEVTIEEQEVIIEEQEVSPFEHLEKEELIEIAQKLTRQTHIDNEVYKRTLAEYDNFRKRTAKEKTETYAMATTNAVMHLLPVIDTLEMAFLSPCEDENYKKGIEMTLMTAKSALEKLAVEEIDALDKPFDVNLHSAVVKEDVEGKESGIVTKVLQKGYTLNKKVIRHATVAVSN